MRFNYTGVTRTRETVKGSLEAPDEIEARNRLRSMQIRPQTLQKEAPPGFLTSLFASKSQSSGSSSVKRSPSFNIPLTRTIDLKGMVIFTRQFSSLVDSGVPIVQCLDILHQQERRPAFKKVLAQVKGDIEGGSGLAESLARHRNTFNELFIRIVEAGEVSGTLDLALRRVGIQLEKLGKLKSKVIGAMLYPVITFVVAIGVLIFLLIKVIPEVSKLYNASEAELPELTRMVLGLSNWVQDNGFNVVGGLVVSVIGFMVAYQQDKFREVFDPILLKTPLFGSLIKKSAVARFTRTMSTLIASGVPLLNAFEICLKVVSNRAIYKTIRNAASFVSEGKSIAQGLGAGGIFPPMVVHMVSIGEMTGRLDELMGKVADIYDDEVDDAVNALTGLLQPMMIIGVGGIIAFLLLAMYLPIFQLAEKTTGS